MSILASLAGEIRAASPGPGSDFWYTSYPGTLSASGMRVSPETAMRVSAVFACVKLLAETVASLPLKIYRRQADGGKRPAPEHPLYGILHSKPNEQQNSLEWREQLMCHACLYGNAYAEIVPGKRGFVDQLVTLHPDRVTVRNARGRLWYEYRPQSGPMRELAFDDVFALRGLSFDGVLGVKTVEVARDIIGMSLAMEEYGSRMYSNGAQLGGVLEHPGRLTADAIKRLREQFDERHAGASKSFKTLVAEEGMKWTQVSMRACDAQFLESWKFQVSEIARLFRVPPHMIADVDGSTSWGTGIEQQQIGFVVHTIRPWLVRWEQAISQHLILATDTYFPRFSIDGLLRGDIKSRFEAYQIAITNGWMSPNEVRELEDMNPRDGGDEYLRPLNMTTGADPTPADAPAQDPGQARLQAVARAAAERLANKEAAAVRKALARAQAGTDDLVAWADEFYTGFGVDISAGLNVPYAAAEVLALRAKQELLDVRAVSDERADELTALALGGTR